MTSLPSSAGPWAGSASGLPSHAPEAPRGPALLLDAVVSTAIQRQKMQVVIDSLVNTATSDSDPKVRISAARALTQLANLQLKATKAIPDSSQAVEGKHVHIHVERDRPELSSIAAKLGVDILPGPGKAG